MIRYRTVRYELCAVEVDRETEKTVWMEPVWGGRLVQEAKRSKYQNYFATWDEAHTFLMEKASRNIENAREVLKRAQSNLGNIKGMKRPDGV